MVVLKVVSPGGIRVRVRRIGRVRLPELAPGACDLPVQGAVGMQPVVTGSLSTYCPFTSSTITEEAPHVQSSFGSAGAEPTAMSDTARRHATASLLSDTSRTCHDQRLFSIGRPAHFQVSSGLVEREGHACRGRATWCEGLPVRSVSRTVWVWGSAEAAGPTLRQCGFARRGPLTGRRKRSSEESSRGE
jgi:hypothetical protein